MSTENPKVDSFRDRISTVDKQGKRVWIYPKKPKGPKHRARAVTAFFLLAFLFLAPFFKINGHPVLQFNILERKFFIFGLAFWPQDFHLFVLATLTLVIFIVLFTVVFGRLWCGWACPQTVFMEMVFRKIDYLIEGDARQQRLLKERPWDADKILRKGSKHIIFYAISFLIGNTFLAYIIGVDELFKIINDPPSEHIGGLTAMIIFSFVFYWVFAFFREQACTMVCPYGRLQGVLLDPNSIVVAYDFKRGEPRGKIKKNDTTEKGDCVDCNLCVDVCPTGIDIRNGTQLECVNCTACIDACDDVMTKVKRPKGLIRYDSYKGISEGVKLKFTPRIAGYSAVLVILVTLLTILMFNRSDVETTILRTPGVLYQETNDGYLTNLYNIKIVNKTFQELPVRIKLDTPEGRIRMIGGDINVDPDALAESAFFVELPKDKVNLVNTRVHIGVYSGEKKLEDIETSFIGPNRFK